MPAQLAEQDWGFRVLWLPDKPRQLKAVCCYELARESRHIMTEFEWWLRFKEPRAELFQKAEEQGIKEEDLQRAFLYVIQDEKYALWRRAVSVSAESRKKPIPMDRDSAAARKLLSGFCDKYREVVRAEYNVQTIESFGDAIGAPRLRFVAEHLVKDTPWLRIPKVDRDNAIAASARALTFFRSVPAVERVDELRELVRSRKADSGMFLGEEDIKIPDVRVRWDRTDRAIRESWAQLGERLVINRRPKGYKAKATGRRRPDSWCWVALKRLAAMRLAHSLPPERAYQKFLELYPSKNFDESNFYRMRRQSISTFQKFFNTEEAPRHKETWRQRR
jgi:hypothetical protein